ncbi:MAG: DUF3520 domain-containing protein [bacterium]|nr:DUF3520 domain-containing protein [bacterium]
MKDQFDKYRNRQTDAEKESLWQDITEPRNRETEHRVQFWRGLGLITSAVAIILAVMLIGNFGPHDSDRFDKLAVSHLEPQTGELPTERIRREIEESVIGKDLASAPGASHEDPAVAASDPTPREAVAMGAGRSNDDKGSAHDYEAMQIADATAKKAGQPPVALSGSVEVDEAESDEAADMTVLVLEPELVDSIEDPVRAGTGMICGKVINADTGDPLPFANVVVEGTKFGAMTKEDGSFCFYVPIGQYTIVTSYMGFHAATITDLVVGNESLLDQDFALTRNEGLRVQTFFVDGEGPIGGGNRSTIKKLKDSGAPGTPAVDNLSEVQALEEEPAMKGNPLHKRGGRAGEVDMMISGVPISDSRDERAGDRNRDEDVKRGRDHRSHGRCWWPPDADLPNGELYDAMFFEHYGVNPFIITDEDALSTFAIDVDNASYTIARRYINEGNLPPKEAIRVEEFVNYFDQGYESVEEGDFAIRLDGAPTPFTDGYHLLRVSMQGREVTPRERKAANLIFVIDTSGSMNRENRLGLVKRALGVLLNELDDADTVGIVEYGSRGRIVLRPTSVENRREIEQAIRSLVSNGSTNAEEGLSLAYTMASKIEDPSIINRVILCSDGVANTGETQAERILDNVRYQSDRGIYLSTIGFGMGNYNDILMEKLANKGDGNYYYVDDIDEANRVFRENLTGTLQTIARDAKIQVEFDPEHVLRYRLLGYENRDVADDDFRNDAVDAGEIGAGHVVTALYELKLTQNADNALRRSNRGRVRNLHLGVARLRYEYPRHDRDRAGQVVELEEDIVLNQFSRRFDEASRNLKLDAIVAEFAEILRGSFWARGSNLGDLSEMLDEVVEYADRGDDLREFRHLLDRAARLIDDDR